jgi:UDP-N-acetylglucosamine 3-dehydrogenase
VKTRLRIGVVGAGAVLGRYHIPAINGVPEVVRSIVVDANAEAARQAATRYGFPKWSTDLADVARHSDLAIVLVPNGLHAQISCELLSNGIHVLCEKPMARNVEECRAMIGASLRGRSLLCIGHNRRFRPHVVLGRQLLHKALIGDILDVSAEEGSASDWPRSASYFDPKQAGGGALLDVGIHSIDLIRWLAGEFEEVTYKGNGSESNVESEAEMSFRLATGGAGKVIVSRNRNLAQMLTLTGTDGFIEIGLWEPHVGMRAAKGKAFQNLSRLDVAVSRRPPQDSSFVEQLRNFVSAIRGEETLLVTGEEGMGAVDVVSRAYSSGEPGISHLAVASGESN